MSNAGLCWVLSIDWGNLPRALQGFEFTAFVHYFPTAQHPPSGASIDAAGALFFPFTFAHAYFSLLRYASIARLISSATGAPVFSESACNFLSCSSLRNNAVRFMRGIVPYRHTYAYIYFLWRASHWTSLGSFQSKRT